MSFELHRRVVAEIESTGPMPFSRFVEHALYDPTDGFYAATGRAGGRGGDFVTSVEVGPLFGAVVADWLDGVWQAAGEPTDFRVAEVGAGAGTLYRAIHRAQPRCLTHLHYHLVEQSARLRADHESLPAGRRHSCATLPEHALHAVVANELLDNLPFDIAERVDGGWAPVSVTSEGDELCFAAGPASPALDHLCRLAPAAEVGARVPVSSAAIRWVGHALDRAERVLVFDYGASTAELADRGQAGWLRTYAHHVRGSDPFHRIGGADITHDVPIDQLPSPASVSTQADWLRANGIDARVEAARRTWHERAHIGDLQAVAARSAIGEADALTDPTGLGSFAVLEWS